MTGTRRVAKASELAAGTDAGSDPRPVEDPRGVDPFERGHHPLGAVDQLLPADAQRHWPRAERGRSDVQIGLVDVERVGEDGRRAGLA